VAGTEILATNAYTSLGFPCPDRSSARGDGRHRTGRQEQRRSADLRDCGYQYWRQLPDVRVLAAGYRDGSVEKEVGYVAGSGAAAAVSVARQRVNTAIGTGHRVTHAPVAGQHHLWPSRMAGLLGVDDEAQ
jgi:hypothetical protein